MNVTQPAITQAVQTLERAFGTRLVERGQRGQRGVCLTKAGQAALVHLRIARREVAAAQEAVTAPLSPSLRVGCVSIAMLSMLPRALACFREEMPQVQVRIVENTVGWLWEKLNAGKLEAIVCKLPSLSESQPMPVGVALSTMGNEELVIVAPLNHPASELKNPDMKALIAWDWTLPPVGSFTRLEFDKLCTRNGVQSPTPAVRCASFHSNLHIAALNNTLTIAPRTAALQYVNTLMLKVLPVDWPGQQSEIVFACRESALALAEIKALRRSCVGGRL